MRTISKKLLATSLAIGTLSVSGVAFAAEGETTLRSPLAGRSSVFANLSDADVNELKTSLQACRTTNEGDREARKACAETAFAAKGIEMPERKFRLRGISRASRANLSDEAKVELKADLDTCRAANEGDRDAIKTCMRAAFTDAGVEVRTRRSSHRRAFISTLAPEVQTELEACRTNNEGDRSASKACTEGVFETNNIEKPERPERRSGRRGVPTQVQTSTELAL